MKPNYLGCVMMGVRDFLLLNFIFFMEKVRKEERKEGERKEERKNLLSKII